MVSIVVPVLDEAQLIGSFLAHLRASAPEAEIIVVDGGSKDETIARARASPTLSCALRAEGLGR